MAATTEVEEEDINKMTHPILCFPNLQRLGLVDLPKLKGIWKGTMTCDSLQNLLVLKCRKLKRLPFSVSVHINDGDGQRRASTMIQSRGIGSRLRRYRDVTVAVYRSRIGRYVK